MTRVEILLIRPGFGQARAAVNEGFLVADNADRHPLGENAARGGGGVRLHLFAVLLLEFFNACHHAAELCAQGLDVATEDFGETVERGEYIVLGQRALGVSGRRRGGNVDYVPSSSTRSSCLLSMPTASSILASSPDFASSADTYCSP